ncbi:hypothetical protein PGTUg99_000497 [Puccinia graminis f. sp. tritici]|uniref:Uncharacterized protein n=1 Tax=Puccinia graminis f. sp. tritici TaxID=56615 RepID=A0A5B0QL63_PUCGR|nr:hypothetical protein PGTUg99_000497 [Puccinia graminis f. sp. tritici]
MSLNVGTKLYDLPNLLDHTMEMKIAKRNQEGNLRKFGHLSVMDLATQTGPLEGWNPKIASEFKPKKSHPTKHRLERDTFSPEVEIIEKAHASFQSPTYDSDIRAEHCKNVTNRKEPNGKKPQYESRISNTPSHTPYRRMKTLPEWFQIRKQKNQPNTRSRPSLLASKRHSKPHLLST